MYKERNFVERSINRLKQFRRVATRYEKRAVNFLAMVTLAAIMLLVMICKQALVLHSLSGNKAEATPQEIREVSREHMLRLVKEDARGKSDPKPADRPHHKLNPSVSQRCRFVAASKASG